MRPLKSLAMNQVGLFQLLGTENLVRTTSDKKGLACWAVSGQKVKGLQAWLAPEAPTLALAIARLSEHLLFFFLASFSEGHSSRRPQVASDWPAHSLPQAWEVP